MTRTVTATEAKNRLGALIRTVSEGDSAVVIESRREPVAILISPGDFEELLQWRKEKQRKAALELLRDYQEKHTSANDDLSEVEIASIAQRAAQEIVEGLREAGAIQFERD
jgi:prevent-host-death family protein